ncbi:MAG: hypothetical protein ACKE9I_03610 [Methylophagaceae bacterium]
MRVFFTHIYVIVMAVFVVTVGNIVADKYGSIITAEISSLINSADREINDVQESVVDWNKKILE